MEVVMAQELDEPKELLERAAGGIPARTIAQI
jgi:hypothetical protein